MGGFCARAWSFGKTVVGVGVGVGELPPPQPTVLVIDIPAIAAMAAVNNRIPESFFMIFKPLFL